MLWRGHDDGRADQVKTLNGIQRAAGEGLDLCGKEGGGLRGGGMSQKSMGVSQSDEISPNAPLKEPTTRAIASLSRA